MKPRYILLAAAVVAALTLMSWPRWRRTGSQPERVPPRLSLNELSEGEQKIERLIREVHGDAILSERFFREGGNAKVELDLDTNKTTRVSGTNTLTFKSVTIDLSSLARQQKQGLSDGVVKASLRF